MEVIRAGLAEKIGPGIFGWYRPSTVSRAQSGPRDCAALLAFARIARPASPGLALKVARLACPSQTNGVGCQRDDGGGREFTLVRRLSCTATRHFSTWLCRQV